MTALIARKVSQKKPAFALASATSWQAWFEGSGDKRCWFTKSASYCFLHASSAAAASQDCLLVEIHGVFLRYALPYRYIHTQFSSGTPVLLSSDWLLIGLSPRVRRPCSCLSLLSSKGSASKQCICATESNKLLYHTGGLVLQLHYMITIVAFDAPESPVLLLQTNTDHCDSKQRMEKILMVYDCSVCLMCRRLNILQTNKRFVNDVIPLKACIWIMMASCNGE